MSLRPTLGIDKKSTLIVDDNKITSNKNSMMKTQKLSNDFKSNPDIFKSMQGTAKSSKNIVGDLLDSKYSPNRKSQPTRKNVSQKSVI